MDEINTAIRAFGKQYERQTYIIYTLGIIRDEADFHVKKSMAAHNK